MKTFLIVSLLSVGLMSCLKTRSELEGMELQRKNQSQISSAQQAKADSESKLYAIQDELRNIMGRLEMMERSQAEGQDKGPTNQDVVEQMKIFEQTISALRARVEELEGQLQEAQSKVPAPSGGSAVAPKGESSPEWTQAEDSFNKKEWKNAILKYQAYRDKNPKGKNYALATYKIGVCFQELKMNDEAKAFYDEVLEKFPQSATAKKAKYRRNQMKKK